MGTGAVPIRPVQQTVGTPSADLSPNPFHAEPLEDIAGPALEGVGKDVMGIWQLQQEHANAIDEAQRMGSYLGRAGQAKSDALNSGQQGPDMVANYGKALAAIQAETIAGTEDPANPNPPNRAVARQLELATTQHIGQETGSFPSEAALRVREDLARKLPQNINLQVSQIAQDPQSFAVTGPDGKTFDPSNTDSANQPKWRLTSKGMDRIAVVQKLTHGATTGMPDQEQFWNNYAAQQLVRQHAMSIAADPVMAPHIAAFLSQPENAAILTPEERTAATNLANDSMDGPMRQIEADGKAAQAQTYNNLRALKAKGQLADSVVVDAVHSFKLPKELGEQLIEKPIEDPTIPSVFNAVRQSLEQATTPEAGEMILAGAGIKGSGISSTDAAKLRAYWAGVKPMLNDPIHTAIQQYGGAGGWLDQQYRPLDETEMDQWGNSMNPAVRNNQMAAKNYFNSRAELVTRGKDPAAALGALQDLATQARKLYTPPPGLIVSPETRARVDKLPPAIVGTFAKTRDLTQLPETSVEPAR